MRRPATLKDVEAIVAMGERFRSQTVFATRYAANPDQVRALTVRVITDPDGLVLVAEHASGDLVGMLAAIVYTHHISGARVAGEVAWWVDPDVRGSLGVRMLKDVERWARRRGAETFDMMAPTPRVEQIYACLGYEPVERTFMRRL